MSSMLAQAQLRNARNGLNELDAIRRQPTSESAFDSYGIAKEDLQWLEGEVHDASYAVSSSSRSLEALSAFRVSAAKISKLLTQWTRYDDIQQQSKDPQASIGRDPPPDRARELAASMPPPPKPSLRDLRTVRFDDSVQSSPRPSSIASAPVRSQIRSTRSSLMTPSLTTGDSVSLSQDDVESRLRPAEARDTSRLHTSLQQFEAELEDAYRLNKELRQNPK